MNRYESELETVSKYPGVILCPFYPSKKLVSSQWGIVNRLNNKVCRLNASKKEGTPAITRTIFGQSKQGHLFFNWDYLCNDVHPGERLAKVITETLHEFIHRHKRKVTTDLRGIIPVRKDNRKGEIRADTRIKRVRFAESREQRIDREDLREALKDSR